MNWCPPLIRAGLGALVLVFFVPLAGAQIPTVKAIWILPTDFKEDGKPQPSPAPDFATPAKLLLNAMKSRAPAPLLSTPTILEGPDVTRSKVMTTLQETLDSLTPGSILLFYYAGHGIRLGGANTTTSSGATYLAMQNCEVGTGKPSYDNMILLAELMDLQARYEHVYFMGYIDACYSGNQLLLSDTLFWSTQLGYKAFLLCSSSASRKSYDSAFTKALTSVYQRDELFNNIRSPKDIYDLTLSSYKFEPEQMVRLIPENSNLYVTYPLPGLCFYCIDFGGLIQKEILVEITPPGGKTTRCRFNDRVGQAIGVVAFPVQQLNGVQITVNVDSKTERTFTADLKGRPFGRKPLGGLGIVRPIVQSTVDEATLRMTAAEFRSVINRARSFGLTDNDIADLGTPLLASYFGKLEFTQSGAFVSEQAAFLANNAPNSPRSAGLRLIAGIDSPSKDSSGMAALESAFSVEVPMAPSLATAYTQNIQANITLLQKNSEVAWITPEEITDKLAIAAQAAKESKDSSTTKALKDVESALSRPDSQILSKRDFEMARDIIRSERTSRSMGPLGR